MGNVLYHSCPFCGRVNNRVADTDDEGSMPSPGDAGFCIGCGEWFFFTENFGTRKPTEDEYPEIATNLECRQIRESWLKARELSLRDVLN